jgi:hypothetical protein
MRRPYVCTDEKAVRIINEFIRRYPVQMRQLCGYPEKQEYVMFYQLVNQLWGDPKLPAPIDFNYDTFKTRIFDLSINPDGNTEYLDPHLIEVSLLLKKLGYMQPAGWKHIKKKCPAEYKLFLSLGQRDMHNTTRDERDELYAKAKYIDEAYLMREKHNEKVP